MSEFRIAPRKFLREGELAERWRVDVKTLQRWRYLSKGPHYVKLCGCVVYPVDVIEAFECQHLVPMGGWSDDD
jgi:hypothetical protein